MKRILICLFAMLGMAQGTWATDYVTDVMLIGAGKSINNLKKQYQNEGWTLIDYDLNKGAGGAYVFLLYKTESSTGSSGKPITDFYLKVSGRHLRRHIQPRRNPQYWR